MINIMGDIMEFLSPKYITIYIDILIGIGLFFGFLWGVKRGLIKASWRLLTVAIAGAVAVFTLPLIMNGILGFKVPASIFGMELPNKIMDASITGKTINDVIVAIANGQLGATSIMGVNLTAQHFATIMAVMQALVISFIALFVFGLYFLVLKFISWIFFAIFVKDKKHKEAMNAYHEALKNKKPKDPSPAKPKVRFKLLGGLVGFVQAGLVAIIMWMPINTLSGFIVRANVENNNEGKVAVAGLNTGVDGAVGDYLMVFENTFFNKAVSFQAKGVPAFDELFADMATTQNVKIANGDKIKVGFRQEIHNLLAVTDKIEKYDIDMLMDALDENDMDAVIEYLASEYNESTAGGPATGETSMAITTSSDTDKTTVVEELMTDVVSVFTNSTLVRAVLVDSVNLGRDIVTTAGGTPGAAVKYSQVDWDEDTRALAGGFANIALTAKDLLDAVGGMSALEDSNSLMKLETLDKIIASNFKLKKLGDSIDAIVDISLIKPIARPAVAMSLSGKEQFGVKLDQLELENTSFGALLGFVDNGVQIYALAKVMYDEEEVKTGANTTEARLTAVVEQFTEFLFTNSTVKTAMLMGVNMVEKTVGVDEDDLSVSDEVLWTEDKEALSAALSNLIKDVARAIAGKELSTLTGAPLQVLDLLERNVAVSIGASLDAIYNMSLLTKAKDNGIDYLMNNQLAGAAGSIEKFVDMDDVDFSLLSFADLLGIGYDGYNLYNGYIKDVMAGTETKASIYQKDWKEFQTSLIGVLNSGSPFVNKIMLGAINKMAEEQAPASKKGKVEITDVDWDAFSTELAAAFDALADIIDTNLQATKHDDVLGIDVPMFEDDKVIGLESAMEILLPNMDDLMDADLSSFANVGRALDKLMGRETTRAARLLDPNAPVTSPLQNLIPAFVGKQLDTFKDSLDAFKIDITAFDFSYNPNAAKEMTFESFFNTISSAINTAKDLAKLGDLLGEVTGGGSGSGDTDWQDMNTDEIGQSLENLGELLKDNPAIADVIVDTVLDQLNNVSEEVADAVNKALQNIIKEQTDAAKEALKEDLGITEDDDLPEGWEEMLDVSTGAALGDIIAKEGKAISIFSSGMGIKTIVADDDERFEWREGDVDGESAAKNFAKDNIRLSEFLEIVNNSNMIKMMLHGSQLTVDIMDTFGLAETSIVPDIPGDDLVNRTHEMDLYVAHFYGAIISNQASTEQEKRDAQKTIDTYNVPKMNEFFQQYFQLNP